MRTILNVVIGKRSCLAFLFTFLFACSDMDSRPEAADKLTPILTLVNPPANSKRPTEPLSSAENSAVLPGQSVRLELHFIAPENFTGLTVTGMIPEPRPQVVSISDWTISAPESNDYPGVRHITVSASRIVPTLAELDALNPSFAELGFTRLRYTFLVSDGTRDLPFAGDFVVYRDAVNAGQLKQIFQSKIESPAIGEAVAGNKIEITSSFQNLRDEGVKIGWYVSGGKIKNRRASSTEWEIPGSGNYTLIFTIRGTVSRNGEIQIRVVNVP